jgi:peptidoglycan pentaglycine glycine transferase (the first glycine)
MGNEWYDLWGVAPANEHDHPWQGVGVFKRKFGGIRLNLVPTFDYVYDSAAYRQYVATECDSDSETSN